MVEISRRAMICWSPFLLMACALLMATTYHFPEGIVYAKVTGNELVLRFDSDGGKTATAVVLYADIPPSAESGFIDGYRGSDYLKSHGARELARQPANREQELHFALAGIPAAETYRAALHYGDSGSVFDMSADLTNVVTRGELYELRPKMTSTSGIMGLMFLIFCVVVLAVLACVVWGGVVAVRWLARRRLVGRGGS